MPDGRKLIFYINAAYGGFLLLKKEVKIMTILEMKQKRAKIFEELKALNDKIKSENRAYTAEEEEQFQRMNDDIDKIGKDIEKEERVQKLEGEMEKLDEAIKPDPKGQRDAGPVSSFAKDEYRAAFGHYLVNGARGLNPENADILRNVTKFDKEMRALQVDQDIYGGYIVAPEQFVMELIKDLDNEVFMRRLATTYQVPTAESLGAPSLDNDPADPEWTQEVATGDEDSTMSFGKRVLYPHPLAKKIKVSRTLLRKARMGAEALVRGRMSYKFAVTEENAYFNGTGSNQPLGVFVASNDGIPSGSTYDISTGNTDTTIEADGLVEAKYALKAQYLAGANWIFHRDAIKQIRKLKTGEGDYIWRPGIATDKPDTILEVPYYMSEYAPNTFTSGSYVGIIGNFKYYWIADALSMEMQRLDELYAETNQVGFIGRKETDGMPVLATAFRRVTLA